MHRQLTYLSAFLFLLLSACSRPDTANSTKQCPLHHVPLSPKIGFFAQDGSAKLSRDLIPFLAEANKLYPHMTPWDFSPHQSETYPTPGNTETCPQCNLAVSTRLKRAYPNSEY